MRDFREAKVMARSLREALKAKAISVTHGESLELIAKILGVDNWNILAAEISAADRGRSETLQCSFCNKPPSEIEALIAGPGVFICNECIALCTNALDERDLSKLMDTTRAQPPETPPASALQDHLRGRSTGQLLAYQRDAQRRLQHTRAAIRTVGTLLGAASSEPLMPGPMQGFLRAKPRKELAAMKKQMEENLTASTSTLQMVTNILHERGQ
ncbi:MAG TPA: ClpX C4-type zinc finger protein [Rhodopila sp.]